MNGLCCVILLGGLGSAGAHLGGHGGRRYRLCSGAQRTKYLLMCFTSAPKKAMLQLCCRRYVSVPLDTALSCAGSSLFKTRHFGFVLYSGRFHQRLTCQKGMQITIDRDSYLKWEQTICQWYHYIKVPHNGLEEACCSSSSGVTARERNTARHRA